MPQTISAEPLAQMIRSITLQKRTGVLRVEQLGERCAERGEIYFENGTFMRARAGQEIDKAALQRMREWKQVTCFFQSMSRPYPALTANLRPIKETKSQSERSGADMDHLLPASESTRQAMGSRSSMNRQTQTTRERTTNPLNTGRMEIALSAHAGSSHLPMPTKTTEQPLVLHGTQLEAYTPPEALSSRSIQRWTTHLISELETLPAQGKYVPETPVGTPSFPNALPGRQAIFKVRSAITAAQVIGQMGRHARVVFILLDGRRTIQHIARLTHQTESEVEQILVDLAQRGYVQYVSG